MTDALKRIEEKHAAEARPSYDGMRCNVVKLARALDEAKKAIRKVAKFAVAWEPLSTGDIRDMLKAAEKAERAQEEVAGD